GVPPDNQTKVSDLNRTPSVTPPTPETPRPLLMASPETGEKLPLDKVPPLDKAPLDDGSLTRRTMRPATSPEPQDATPRPVMPPAVMPGASERETSPVAQ